jgi:hypothetical protein
MLMDPEGEVPYYYRPGEPGRPNYGLFGQTGFGDRNTFYEWLEGAYDLVATPYAHWHCARLRASAFRSAVSAPVQLQPASPAPKRSNFASSDAFREEPQARWCVTQGRSDDTMRGPATSVRDAQHHSKPGNKPGNKPVLHNALLCS